MQWHPCKFWKKHLRFRLRGVLSVEPVEPPGYGYEHYENSPGFVDGFDLVGSIDWGGGGSINWQGGGSIEPVEPPLATGLTNARYYITACTFSSQYHLNSIYAFAAWLVINSRGGATPGAGNVWVQSLESELIISKSTVKHITSLQWVHNNYTVQGNIFICYSVDGANLFIRISITNNFRWLCVKVNLLIVIKN